MGMPSDRDSNYMRKMWGTNCLITDYHANLNSKILREIEHDEKTSNKENLNFRNLLLLD